MTEDPRFEGHEQVSTPRGDFEYRLRELLQFTLAHHGYHDQDLKAVLDAYAKVVAERATWEKDYIELNDAYKRTRLALAAKHGVSIEKLILKLESDLAAARAQIAAQSKTHIDELARHADWLNHERSQLAAAKGEIERLSSQQCGCGHLLYAHRGHATIIGRIESDHCACCGCRHFDAINGKAIELTD